MTDPIEVAYGAALICLASMAQYAFLHFRSERRRKGPGNKPSAVQDGSQAYAEAMRGFSHRIAVARSKHGPVRHIEAEREAFARDALRGRQ